MGRLTTLILFYMTFVHSAQSSEFDFKYNPISVNNKAEIEQSPARGSFLFQLENDLLWQSHDIPLMSLSHLKDWGFTSANTHHKKGITFQQADVSLFSVRTKRELIFDGLTHLRVRNNSAEDTGFFSLYGAYLRISNNEEVLLEQNCMCGTASPQSGSVILGAAASSIIIGNNICCGIKENRSCNAHVTQGGAISTGMSNLFILHHNSELNITNNSTTGITEGYGGAIYVGDETDAQLTHNGNVLISGNCAAGANVAFGGAFFCDGNLMIAGNESVTLENNVENTDEITTLRSIHTTDFYEGKKLDLSAPAGGHITIYDSIRIGAQTAVNFNADGSDLLENAYTGGGDIIFSGAKTKQHLEEILKRTATDEELAASRTSIIRNLTHLHAGRLIVQDDAILKSFGLKALTGKGATIFLDNGHIDSSGYDIEFQDGTCLHISGQSSIRAQTLTLQKGAQISFTLDATGKKPNNLQFIGNLVWEEGAKLQLDSNGTPEDGVEFALLSVTGPNLPSPESLLIEGTYTSPDFFTWKDGTLYYQFKLPELHLATWSAANGFIWDKEQKNWQQGSYTYAYKDGIPILFGDTGCGTIQLSGDLAPQQVLVNNGSSHDYCWVAASTGGKLTGGMKLIKQGSGNLSICTGNDFTGGTEISNGTLITSHPHALGSGDIHLLGGTLHAHSKLEIAAGQELIFEGGCAGGELVSTQGAVISLEQDSVISSGTLTLGGGTLQLHQHHLDIQGTLNLTQETCLDVREYANIGSYKLITWQQQTGDLDLLKLQTSGSLRYTTLVQNNSLMLHIVGDSLHWVKPSGIWSHHNPNGWESGFFTSGEAVRFEQGGAITIEGSVAPSSIYVSGNKDTDFSGSGRISGNTTLTKEGSGVLCLGTDNDFTGKIIINEGIVNATHPNALGRADIEINKATLQSPTLLELKQKLNLFDGTVDGSVLVSPQGQLRVQRSGFINSHLHLSGGSIALNEIAKLHIKGNYHQHSGTLQLNRYCAMNMAGNMELHSGSIALSYASSINVGGSLTISGNTSLLLESGAFADGDILISTQAPLVGDLSAITLIYNENLTTRSDAIYELRFIDNNVVLYRQPDDIPFPEAPPPTPEPEPEPVPSKQKHNELSLANWGIALASHVFSDALHSSKQNFEELPDEIGHIWVSGLGGYMRLHELYNPEIFVSGAAVGVNFVYSDVNQIGLAIGSTYAVGYSDDMDMVEQSGTMLALHGSNALYADEENAVQLQWGIIAGKHESDMKNKDAGINPESMQADTRVNWEHRWHHDISTLLFINAQYLTVNRDSTDTFETEALRYLRTEVGGGLRWQASDYVHVYAESAYQHDIMRHNPTDSRNPGRTGFRASIGMQQLLGHGVYMQTHYSWERSLHAISLSGHISFGYSF